MLCVITTTKSLPWKERIGKVLCLSSVTEFSLWYQQNAIPSTKSMHYDILSIKAMPCIITSIKAMHWKERIEKVPCLSLVTRFSFAIKQNYALCHTIRQRYALSHSIRQCYALSHSIRQCYALSHTIRQYYALWYTNN